jgi:hypothetical protein
MLVVWVNPQINDVIRCQLNSVQEKSVTHK